jgi:hypothetical protein
VTPSKKAELEFERLPSSYAMGTSKLYSRGDFLPLDDPLAFDEGDFIGRLRALFGVAEDDEYVLRHRGSGYVITVYSAQSGPSYGGGPRYQGPLPEADEAALFTAGIHGRHDPSERIAADPELAAGAPSSRLKNRWRELDFEAQQRLRELDHDWHRRYADASAPPGFAEAVARLDQLLNEVVPLDWEEIRYYGDGPSVYRVGVCDGESFCEDLTVGESLDILASKAEARDDSMKDTAGSPFDEPNMRAVEYWVMTKMTLDAADEYEDEEEDDEYEEDEYEDDEEDEDDEDDEARAAALERALPRIQAAWFRAVEALVEHDGELREHMIEHAREHARALGIDAEEAEAALAAIR